MGDRGDSDPGAGMPTVDAIRETARLAPTDPRQASDRMLQGYYQLSTTLGELLHGRDTAPINATFLTFATWTTETLRIDVVKEEARRPLGARGLVRPGRLAYRRVAGWVLGDDDVVARNLARGEAAIYEEIGLATRTLVTTMRNDRKKRKRALAPSAAEWTGVWNTYTANLVRETAEVDAQRRDAPELHDPVGPTNCAVLHEAVLPYFEVVATGLDRPQTDAAGRKRRAELILLGTMRLEAYAQLRLQLVLERNLSYIPDALRTIVASRLTGRTNLPTMWVRRAYERNRKVSEVVDEAIEIAATRHVYSVVLGQEVLGLGRDLPLPPPANPTLRGRVPEADRERYALGSFFPYELQTLREPDVWAWWQQSDRSTGEGKRTAVDNWLRYEERVNFIVNLFRSRQQVSALYDEPRSLRAPAPAPERAPVAGSPSVATLPPREAPLDPMLPAASKATEKRLRSRGGGQ